RRRRCVLAAPGPRGTHRLLAGRRRLASPPQVDPEVLEAAGRLREGRGPVGTQVAGSIQFGRATELARTPLRQGRLARVLGASWPANGRPGGPSSASESSSSSCTFSSPWRACGGESGAG